MQLLHFQNVITYAQKEASMQNNKANLRLISKRTNIIIVEKLNKFVLYMHWM